MIRGDGKEGKKRRFVGAKSGNPFRHLARGDEEEQAKVCCEGRGRMSDAEEYAEEEELDLSDSDVVTKYKAAADITNKTMAYVLASVKPGTLVVELCESADALLESEIEKVFNKPTKEGMIEKGIAFPTCLSINNCCGHFSPMVSDATVINEGEPGLGRDPRARCEGREERPLPPLAPPLPLPPSPSLHHASHPRSFSSRFGFACS